MRVAVIHNAVSENSPPDERDVLDQAAAVTKALENLGHTVVTAGCDLNLAGLRNTLERLQPDIVFNLVESLEGHGRLIAVVPFLLETLGLPYTGARAGAIYGTSHKVVAKTRLRRSGLPTPDWVGPFPPETRANYIPSPTAGPLIIKSLWEHASLGMGADGPTIVTSSGDIMNLLARRAPSLGGACFAETYVDGREFNLSILAGPEGPQALRPAEIVFEDFSRDRPRIVCYKAKWESDSFEYTHTRRRFDLPASDAALLQRLRGLALKCWDIFDLRGYARVDFRVDGQGNPWILEINANPCLSPDAGFAAALKESGISFEDAMAAIIKDALVQRQQSPASHHGFSGHLDEAGEFRYHPQETDLDEVGRLVAATGFFSPEEVAVAVELVADRLEKGEASDYAFVFAIKDGRLAGYACHGPIPCTKGSFDLYWIAVHPKMQRQGLGRRLLAETERRICLAGGRQVYIDTSLRDTYRPTRTFYETCGYKLIALLPDFYAPGDGKAVFCKRLGNIAGRV